MADHLLEKEEHFYNQKKNENLTEWQ